MTMRAVEGSAFQELEQPQTVVLSDDDCRRRGCPDRT